MPPSAGDRRTFVRVTLRAAAAAAVGGAWRPAATRGAPGLALRLWLADPPDAAAAAALAFGVDEAARSGAPFGLTVTLGRLATHPAAPRAGGDAEAGPAAIAAAFAPVRAGDAVVGGATPETCARLAGAARARGAVYVNPWCDDDALRTIACDAAVVHVAPSARMRRAALAASGAPSAAPTTTADDTRAVAWHASLERYGAAQLSARYRSATGRTMDEPAWTAWAAAKLLAEAVLRAGPGEPLGTRLARPGLVVDLQKGAPLRVRAADRQLEQPLYVVRGDGAAEEVVAEVPRVEGPDGGVGARLAAFGAPFPTAAGAPSSRPAPCGDRR